MKPYYAAEGVTVYHADAIDVLTGLEAGSVDAVITDPPYGIQGSRGKINLSRGKGNYGEQFNDSPQYISDVVIPIVRNLISFCGCVILTPGNPNFCLYPQPDSFGCFYQPASVGMQTFGNSDAQPIFYYGKNATKHNLGKHCSYQVTEVPEKNGHPCVKPLKVWTKIVENNTLPGHVVFDPFMGSGTTAVACIRTGRRFIGCDISREYCDIAIERIERELAQPRLFTQDDAAAPAPTQGALF